MKKDYNALLLKSLGITFLVLFLLKGGIFIFFCGLRILNDGSHQFNYWVMLEAAATALTAASVFGAAYLASRQLSEVCNSRHMEAANQIFAEMNSKENIEARKLIFKNLPDDPTDPGEVIRKMSQKERNAVKLVLNSLDHVAFITQINWIPEEKLMPWMHPMVYKSWRKLKNLVEYEQWQRREPYYYQNVCVLANHCLEWRKKQNYPDRVEWLDSRKTI